MFGTTAKAEGELRVQQNMFKPPSNLLLTVPRRYFCVGPHFYMVVCPWVSGLQQYGHLNNSRP